VKIIEAMMGGNFTLMDGKSKREFKFTVGQPGSWEAVMELGVRTSLLSVCIS